MERKYTVRIGSMNMIDLDRLRDEFQSGSFHDTFKPTEVFLGGSNLFIVTDTGDEIRARYQSIGYAFVGPLEQQNMLNAVKSALGVAKILTAFPISFNPNLLSLYLGHFSGGDAEFEKEMRPIAIALQKRLYGGGGIGYTQSSNDFSLDLGTEQEIGEKQGILKVKKIEVEGAAQPANSLDELLDRLKQK
ncbi:hypothetical protein HYV80_02020 [Candidatus Woesearchaeota archaeon]|nr:hypothetical protein [Candidatus Woesearchaeota archaeon]